MDAAAIEEGVWSGLRICKSPPMVTRSNTYPSRNHSSSILGVQAAAIMSSSSSSSSSVDPLLICTECHTDDGSCQKKCHECREYACKRMKMESLSSAQFAIYSARYTDPHLAVDVAPQLLPAPDTNPDVNLHLFCHTCLKLQADDKHLVEFLLGRGTHRNLAHLTHDYYRVCEAKVRPRKSKADTSAASSSSAVAEATADGATVLGAGAASSMEAAAAASSEAALSPVKPKPKPKARAVRNREAAGSAASKPEYEVPSTTDAASTKTRARRSRATVTSEEIVSMDIE